MPHKHTRKGEDKSTLDLPPTIIARPLSTSKSAASNGIFTSSLSNPPRTNKKRKRKDDNDDTPKAFARLMAFRAGKKLPKGLDDGVKESKNAKKKRVLAAADAERDDDPDDPTPSKPLPSDAQLPSIRPGERMSEFSARVDAALPVSGLINKTAKNGKDPLGLKVGRTKTEKRMHRMYAEWREQDQRIKERREEAQERAEEEAEDEDGQVRWKVDVDADAAQGASGKKAKKGKKRKVIGELDDGDDDPWAGLKRERGQRVGLNDVVQAPPTFKNLPKEKFKVRGARVEVEDVPKASGSLRRREELGEVRRSVVEGYRAMMKKGKGKPED
ncbi:non sense mediated decay [Hyphodiscus hymeniophilus]|uniref:Non sense mediated decay n=1 Tax=Hyphodiscus hymeniophilus TaxID=353542 RepID=A0A9P6VJK2_9HELO|nr:non sense mediated decay [Hyphodiscus hymeniophilus]